MKHKNTLLVSSLCLSVMLVGCQSNTAIKTEPAPAQISVEPPKEEPRVKITPYPDSGIKRETQPLPRITTQPAPVISSPPRVILPEQKPAPVRQLKDGHGIAAYDRLMQNYLQALKQNNLVEAEKNLLQAQRIAPQSADVYRELARLANLRKQASNAEAFARKGLTFAQSNVQNKQLWQQILHSAQLRNNTLLIQQAQQKIAQY